jgi:hypothetical protein
VALPRWIPKISAKLHQGEAALRTAGRADSRRWILKSNAKSPRTAERQAMADGAVTTKPVMTPATRLDEVTAAAGGDLPRWNRNSAGASRQEEAVPLAAITKRGDATKITPVFLRGRSNSFAASKFENVSGLAMRNSPKLKPKAE